MKNAYKYCLCGIFLNIITGQHGTFSQKANIELIEKIRKLIIKPKEAEDVLNLIIKPNVHKSLTEQGFNPPFDNNFLNNCISFMRDKLQELQAEGVCLFQAREMSRLLEINKFFTMDFVSEFHWIEFNIVKGMVVAVPEAIIFNDLKVEWNNYIDTYTYLQLEMEKVETTEDEFEYYKNEINRGKMYELGALYRGLVFLSVSFVESYLYDLFCCIREIDVSGKESIQNILNVDMVQDTQIIENVLYKLFPDIKNRIESLYQKYKTINNYRNRYVHASPLVDSSNNTSHLKPLLDINRERLIDFLQTSIDLVLKIQDNLPQNLNLLFWWYNDEIKFLDFKKINLTNVNARINKVKYDSI